MKNERSSAKFSELDTVKWLRLYWNGVKDNSLAWKLLVVAAAVVFSIISMSSYKGQIPDSDFVKCSAVSALFIILLFIPFHSPFRSFHWDYRLGFIALYAYTMYNRLKTVNIFGGVDIFVYDWILNWLVIVILFAAVLQLNLIIHKLYAKNNKIVLKIYEIMGKFSLFSRVKSKNDRKIVGFVTVNTLLFTLGSILFVTSKYLDYYFSHMDLETILFTIRFANGTYSTDVRNMIIIMASAIILASVLYFIIVYRKERAEEIISKSPDRKNSIELRLSKVSKRATLIFSCAALLTGIYVICDSLKLVTYIKRNLSKTTLYEDHYVAPTTDIIHFPEKKKNLIYIFLESYENTFTSYENGGNQPTDLMPEIYELEKNNINFSHRSGIGGQSVFFPMIRYTMGSAVAQTSGVPLTSILNIGNNTVADKMSSLLGPLRRLEDVLHDAGYNQMYINGNDTNFAGYNRYVGRYDDSKIYDLINARADGRIPDGYDHPWGFEDRMLFATVKDKVEELAAKDKPFYIATFTIDTHSVEVGFRCKLCDPEIKDDFVAAINCSSRQVNDFINWLSEKPYWKDTVVIFVGDHPSELRAGGLRYEDDNYVRTTCNCIINSPKLPINEKNRTFCAMDMFPTTLSAIGCNIDGDRLGLGTDLFSDTPTLCEEMGADKFVEEVQKKSEYYINTFLVTEK